MYCKCNEGDWRAGASQPSCTNGAEYYPYILYIYIYLRPYVVQLRMLQDYALLFIRKGFNMLTCPLVMSLYTRVCSSVLSHSWISPEKMPFVVEERGKENVVPVRLLRLVCISVACVKGTGKGTPRHRSSRGKGSATSKTSCTS